MKLHVFDLSCVHLAITMLKSLLHHLHNDTQLFFFVNGDHSMSFLIVQGTALVNVQKLSSLQIFRLAMTLLAIFSILCLLQLVVLTSLVRVQLLPPTLVFVQHIVHLIKNVQEIRSAVEAVPGYVQHQQELLPLKCSTNKNSYHSSLLPMRSL